MHYHGKQWIRMLNFSPQITGIGNACFVCESDWDMGNIGSMTTSDCPRCSPTVALDLSQGPRVLEHVGSHILHEPAVVHSIEPLCGLCLRPSPMCQYCLTKGKGKCQNQSEDVKRLSYQNEFHLQHRGRVDHLFALLERTDQLPCLPKS